MADRGGAEFFRHGRAARDRGSGQALGCCCGAWAHLDRTERQTLRHLFALNRRLAKAYLLKEQLAHLWTYTCEGAARRFLTTWLGSPALAAAAGLPEAGVGSSLGTSTAS